jgi:transcriptional regulator with XRE-family HTH domain
MAYTVSRWPLSVYPDEMADECPEAEPEITVLILKLRQHGPKPIGYAHKVLGKRHNGLWQLSLKVRKRQIRMLYAPYGNEIVLFRIHKKSSPQEQNRAYVLAAARKRRLNDIGCMREGWNVSYPARFIEIDLADKLKDPIFRKAFLSAEGSANIAEQIVALRKRRNLNQKEVAELVGTAQPAISRAERADYDSWSYKALKAITDALNARLRVVIEAWEDVAHEYESQEPSEHKEPDTGDEIGASYRNPLPGTTFSVKNDTVQYSTGAIQ